jgi:hypothetical protein
VAYEVIQQSPGPGLAGQTGLASGLSVSLLPPHKRAPSSVLHCCCHNHDYAWLMRGRRDVSQELEGTNEWTLVFMRQGPDYPPTALQEDVAKQSASASAVGGLGGAPAGHGEATTSTDGWASGALQLESRPSARGAILGSAAAAATAAPSAAASAATAPSAASATTTPSAAPAAAPAAAV